MASLLRGYEMSAESQPIGSCSCRRCLHASWYCRDGCQRTFRGTIDHRWTYARWWNGPFLCEECAFKRPLEWWHKQGRDKPEPVRLLHDDEAKRREVEYWTKLEAREQARRIPRGI